MKKKLINHKTNKLKFIFLKNKKIKYKKTI